LDGEAFEEQEAFAVEDVVAESVEEVAQVREGEFGLGCVVLVCMFGTSMCFGR
jgi:hypothetical protein